MPISNEIIELEPVNKGKLKFIISIVIAAVMLALAVTFLVMYIIKPAAEEYTGKVNGVSVTYTELFDTGETDGSGNKVYTASAGNKYIVYAEANIEGDVSDGIRWDVSNNDALIDVKYDREKLEDGSLGRFFCSFTVNADFVASNGESVVSLTAALCATFGNNVAFNKIMTIAVGGAAILIVLAISIVMTVRAAVNISCEKKSIA